MLGGLLLAAGSGWADVDPFAEAQPVRQVDVLVQVEMIEVTHGNLTELMRTPVLARDPMALRVKAQELVRAKKARILHTLMVRTREQSEALVTSAREYIYPTEYEPPELPSSIGSGPISSGKEPPRTPDQPDTPTAFETRDLGESLTAGVIVNRSEGTVKVDLDLRLTRLSELMAWTRRKTPSGNEFATKMPEIENLESAPRLDVPDGGYGFAGVLRRESDPEKRILVFVRCDVLEPEVVE